MPSPKGSKKINEPSMIVRPISRFGGLDNIHIALIVLAIILVLLVFAISANTKISILNLSQGSNCTYGAVNGNCTVPIHTSAQAKLYAEKVLAGYGLLNSSVSLLPYLSNVAQANVSYVPQTAQWLVSIPYTAPLTSNTYILNIVMPDSNLSRFTTFVEISGLSPKVSQNYVAAPGTVKLYGQTSCGTGSTQAYWFIDPYAPGSVPSLVNATNLQAKYAGKLNITYKALYSPYSGRVASIYGLNNTITLSKYILCGSLQSNFTGFVKALNASYTGSYMPAYILQGISEESGFNMSKMNSCVASSQHIINNQAVQAKYYNITSSAAVLVDCQYMAIPQTVQQALCYDNSTFC